MGLFTRKKKTYAEKYPQQAALYNSLSAQQKRVLDDFSYREDRHYKADMKTALTKIATVYVVPTYNLTSTIQIKKKAKAIYGLAKMTLTNAPIVTNVNAKLFASDAFLQSERVKTMWTLPGGKGGIKYGNKRQGVERGAFGYEIDWTEKISVAAENRPVYAALNTVDHPYGCATAYGSVILEYNSAVKSRCTYICKDTFGFHFDTGTPEQLEEERNLICTNAKIECLMGSMSDSQLKALCQRAESRYTYGNYAPAYIEAHVHGGILFSRDLASIRVCRSGESTVEKEAASVGTTADNLLDRISQFAGRFGIPATLSSLTGAEKPI